MKGTFLLFAVFVFASTFSQPMGYTLVDLYEVAGHAIHPGDTLKLGIGSKDNGDFAFIWKYNPGAFMGDYTVNPKLYFPASYSGREIVVSELIKPKKEKWGDQVCIMFKIAGQLMNYRCEIESAVKREELIIPGYNPNPPKVIIQSSVSTADEIKKFKELLDSGVITQEEFDVQKKKLLGE